MNDCICDVCVGRNPVWGTIDYRRIPGEGCLFVSFRGVSHGLVYVYMRTRTHVRVHAQAHTWTHTHAYCTYTNTPSYIHKYTHKPPHRATLPPPPFPPDTQTNKTNFLEKRNRIRFNAKKTPQELSEISSKNSSKFPTDSRANLCWCL